VSGKFTPGRAADGKHTLASPSPSSLEYCRKAARERQYRLLSSNFSSSTATRPEICKAHIHAVRALAAKATKHHHNNEDRTSVTVSTIGVGCTAIEDVCECPQPGRNIGAEVDQQQRSYDEFQGWILLQDSLSSQPHLHGDGSLSTVRNARQETWQPKSRGSR